MYVEHKVVFVLNLLLQCEQRDTANEYSDAQENYVYYRIGGMKLESMEYALFQSIDSKNWAVRANRKRGKGRAERHINIPNIIPT